MQAGGMLEPLAAALWGEAGVKFKSMGQGRVERYAIIYTSLGV